MRRALAVSALLLLTACEQANTIPSESASPPEKVGIKSTVETLAGKIGERNPGRYAQLEQARAYITNRMKAAGYQPELQTFTGKLVKKDVHNLIFEKEGSEEIVVIGAHYDSVSLTPGADDNASGVGVLLHLAEQLQQEQFQRTVRFVFFTNEEPPYFLSDDMGSEVYAKRCKEKDENIVAMLSLETMGFYSDEPGSQRFPEGLTGYPDRGNFLAFVANPESKDLVDLCLEHFRGVPKESLITGESVGRLSDQASFWKYGYPGVMITDTAFFRNPHYHRQSDTPETLDYERLEKAAVGMEEVVKRLATPSEKES